MKTWNATVVFICGEKWEQLIAAASEQAAKRAAHQLAMAAIPYSGTPINISVTVQP